jgi:hypothetical protein
MIPRQMPAVPQRHQQSGLVAILAPVSLIVNAAQRVSPTWLPMAVAVAEKPAASAAVIAIA